ncbi:MAG TPA: FkbM family methyltransferase [Methylomusa anaerophila]|uniref:Methyltransferase FkbM domain-containing protein n=1 Tax=Methylomusa anaerophila TaxID=1930071 RepID=A0A348AH68_9FIRM|nr:FkbM family methyltransferase [Methylomusa anaerophila]BBB90416.1 hypothetical protein MAMMFC1_01067 [Methylomusa anaerophila]HML90369.1 FkbM family methyltransferase [Methylomusa anaerophila]
MNNYNNSYSSFSQQIKNIISSYNSENRKNFSNQLSSAKVYIYGAGNAGTMTYYLLKELNIEIEGFMDKRADSLTSHLNKPVHRADADNLNADLKGNSFVIIALLCSYEELQDIKEGLLKLGYKNSCYYHDIYNLVITENITKENFSSYNLNNHKDIHTDIILKNTQEKVLNVANSLCDEKSREVYYNFLNAILNSNPDLFSPPDQEKQYFVNDISFAKGYSRFIDCGTYDGDTVFALKQCKKSVDKVALFEPESNNFKKLRENLNGSRVANEEILFPCGVWKETEILRFKAGIQSSSAISPAGDMFIQCVALDDVLRDFAPTFIKMDIEGAEYEALLGAENIIRQYAPDLAVSVYHKIEHMWEIPLLIQSFNSNYKFYLRCHALHGMETILYATCEE